ncbi:MAG TPA: hypothetical protein ENG00_01005 [Candidatus Aenigmarchaeota archaeon]|nr:hypothetical protein [Candidatus Aenigmarchaeota archaeon]
MLSDTDKKIMEIISKQLLITKAELARKLNKEEYDGTEVNVSRLIELGYISEVESLGTCLVITQKGIRALKDL